MQTAWNFSVFSFSHGSAIWLDGQSKNWIRYPIHNENWLSAPVCTLITNTFVVQSNWWFPTVYGLIFWFQYLNLLDHGWLGTGSLGISTHPLLGPQKLTALQAQQSCCRDLLAEPTWSLDQDVGPASDCPLPMVLKLQSILEAEDLRSRKKQDEAHEPECRHECWGTETRLICHTFQRTHLWDTLTWLTEVTLL